ncbi:MAG TPA: cupin domain-containing protein [Acidimicrobiales bacterium]|nr:cupin domain-containing protein [Acidimicrobiales bacterium]
MTTTTPTPSPEAGALRLDRTAVVHLASDLSMCALGVDEEAWSGREGAAQFADGRLLSVFAYEATWTWWERHPAGEEFVHVLSGSVGFRLDDGSTERRVLLDAGESLLVPEGVWHSADVASGARLLFVTPVPAATEHRDRSPGSVG